MAGTTPIEWTERTWNPIVGCSIVSPGCTNCYAMGMAARIEAMNAEARETDQVDGKRRRAASQYDGTTKKVNGHVVWTGKVALAPDNVLLAPLQRKKPTTYFVNSMGDLFHEDVPDEWIDRVFAVMALSPQHTFQVLTKRAKRMRRYCSQKDRPLQWVWHACQLAKIVSCYDVADAETAAGWHFDGLPNVWLGVSTERQQEADERIPDLLATPAAIRFISAEPLLGPLDVTSLAFPKSCDCVNHAPSLNALEATVFCEGCCEGPERLDLGKLDWVIVGGESGQHARSMHPDWARSLRDQCAASGTAFFFKQWGEWAPSTPKEADWNPRSGWQENHAYPHVARAEELYPENGAAFVARVGKKAAGRLLDGKLHDEFPTAGRE